MNFEKSNISINNYFKQLLTNTTGDKIVAIDSQNIINISSDSGNTWYSNNNYQNILKIAADNTLQYIIAISRVSDYIYRSIDYGNTFSALTTLSSFWQIITSNSTGQYLVAARINALVAGRRDAVYYSLDYGSSWALSTGNILADTWLNIVSSSDGKYVFIHAQYGQLGIALLIYMSTDYGVTFTENTSYPSSIFSIHSVTCDSTGKYLYVATNSGIYIFNFYSQTWTLTNASVTNGEDYIRISTDLTGKYVVAFETSESDIYYSSDYGSNWVSTNLRTDDKLGYYSNSLIMSRNGKYIYANVYHTNVLYKYIKNILCFLVNTRILTLQKNNKEKYVRIQDLHKGDLIKTYNNGYKQIEYIGHSKIDHNRNNHEKKNKLYLCSTSNYSDLFEDLVITGCHSILVNKLTHTQREDTTQLVERVFLTNDKYRLLVCLDEKAKIYHIDGEYEIWHLALENECDLSNYGIYANGLLVESSSKRMISEYSNMTLID